MLRSTVLCLALLVPTGSPHAADRWYDNPVNPQIQYGDLSKPLAPARAQIRTAVLAEGRRYFSQNLPVEFRDLVIAAATKSGIVELSHASDDLHLEFRLDVDPKEASIVERGGPGSRVNWVQELIVYAPVENGWIERHYLRSILVFRGAAREPEGLGRPRDATELRNQAIEAMVLQALQDLQRDGILPVSGSE